MKILFILKQESAEMVKSLNATNSVQCGRIIMFLKTLKMAVMLKIKNKTTELFLGVNLYARLVLMKSLR